jgi:hypothetical protein
VAPCRGPDVGGPRPGRGGNYQPHPARSGWAISAAKLHHWPNGRRVIATISNDVLDPENQSHHVQVGGSEITPFNARDNSTGYNWKIRGRVSPLSPWPATALRSERSTEYCTNRGNTYRTTEFLLNHCQACLLHSNYDLSIANELFQKHQICLHLHKHFRAYNIRILNALYSITSHVYVLYRASISIRARDGKSSWINAFPVRWDFPTHNPHFKAAVCSAFNTLQTCPKNADSRYVSSLVPIS